MKTLSNMVWDNNCRQLSAVIFERMGKKWPIRGFASAKFGSVAVRAILIQVSITENIPTQVILLGSLGAHQGKSSQQFREDGQRFT